MPDTSKLEKLNRELEKSEKKLRKAINDEKALQHQLKQLTRKERTHRGVRYFSEQQKNFYAVSAYIQSMICRYSVRYRWKSLSRKQKKRCM